ncbi:MAG TPA: thiamine phosphate synthase [Opitutaceae bacterium]|jgi:thiamine-phosphate pyrophosphorylase|nr:thiamine phosphate synthase [Opitutaceae bacterium]
MCLTLDGTGVSHGDQAAVLCAAGARWVQLRMKDADMATWVYQAKAAARVCREHGAVFVVNDSVEVALESGADGVHLGRLDAQWPDARRALGADRLVGGTVNNAADARLAAASGCLDYVGVGPHRFTSTKKSLAPVLGAEGIRSLVALLGALPAWAIGGVEPADLAALRATGVAGVAVSSGLTRGGTVRDNVGRYLAAWQGSPAKELVLS